MCEEPDNFNVGIDVHQVDFKSILLSVVMNEVKKEIQHEVQWCIVFADNIVSVEENLNKVDNRLDE